MTANSSSSIPSAYNPADVERRVYDEWLAKGYFAPTPPGYSRGDQEPFVIIMPPPNVTGELHLGHALEKAIEDALVRWRRMLGIPTLWLPGTDHAGIATQWAVEQQLAAQGKDRHELGREKFVDLVWEHVGKYGGVIHEQSRRLGISADWGRHRFTLDEGPSRAVRTTFVNLYKKGLIYRHERIINWCPRCATALSDLEVEYQDVDGKLYHIRYPLTPDPSPSGRGETEGRGEGYITVATTRPETMLGDTGVAVHPRDGRYRDLVGRRALLPIMDRSIPVVGDEAIIPEFGTGALKVTPGHDPTDFEIGQRHNLPIETVIGLDGNMTQAAGKYAGKERFQTRQEIVTELESLGLLDHVEDYSHSVGHCQRCSSVVEPLVSLQWFVNLGSHDQPGTIAGRAHAAVAQGEITVVPERFTRVYLNWLENIRDWCISRQLWWGHRIPVWYCGACGHQTVSVDDATACESCGATDLRQDPDVLDTWFSSGLWPHSTLGWPEESKEFKYFYPTSVLETGYDILFFWVARMIMMGLENTGQVPFRTVFLHGLVRDATGAKMSKTRGNTMDPLELIDRYGTDALRFSLTTGTAPGNDLRFTEARVEAARNFVNKVWNAARFVLTSLGDDKNSSQKDGALAGWYDLPGLRHREDRWIVSRMDRMIVEVNQLMENFELGEAQQKLYDFIWNDFCDWYIEMAKIRLRQGDYSSDDPSPLPTLVHVLERTLRAMHPFLPFVTEEIWQTLRSRLPDEGSLGESIMISQYPQADGSRLDPEAEDQITLVMQAIRAVRNARAQLRIPANQQLEALMETDGFQRALEEESQVIRSLSRVEPLRIVPSGSAAADQRRGVTLVVNPLVVRLPLEGVVDLSEESQRLQTELDDCSKNLDRVEKLVSNPDFKAKARPEVVQKEQDRLAELQDRRQRLEEIISQLAG
ncbi:MAG: valine--tRNA ligase [SAR202 cluster bacterium Io17-Chloro-G9]|nr:MAG: valine--tRNA ligase [SAR202 cluster bacterium Io17-Chloro-G9]